MFTLSREVEADRAVSVLEAVDKQLARYAVDKDELDGQIAYKIPFFAPIRYSMFAAFTEVLVKPGTTRWQLVLRPVSPWIPLAFGVFTSILFGLTGPVNAWSIALPIGGPMMLYLIWIADGLVRTSRWWRCL